MSLPNNNEAQKLFDSLYITGFEICNELDIPRSTLLRARARGLLPEPILIPGVKAFVWERNKVSQAIEQWKVSLASRRGELA
jgi:hypothetical protein